ncbi:MAG: hypothetical protein J6S57_01830, partial [Alphaproteobacteria bacterium]|nr:hypothetical protein [Alphaproteobacteria bacterium]
MIKKFICFIVLLISVFSTSCVVAGDDDFDFDNFAIVDDDQSDINIDTVSLNSDADVVNVRQFDIAGIMLGMSYDEVNNLFFTNSGLYAPRKKNSVIYTIN